MAKDESNLEPARAQLTEPPYADPLVRWCGRGGRAIVPPIPIARKKRVDSEGGKERGIKENARTHPHKSAEGGAPSESLGSPMPDGFCVSAKVAAEKRGRKCGRALSPIYSEFRSVHYCTDSTTAALRLWRLRVSTGFARFLRYQRTTTLSWSGRLLGSKGRKDHD